MKYLQYSLPSSNYAKILPIILDFINIKSLIKCVSFLRSGWRGFRPSLDLAESLVSLEEVSTLLVLWQKLYLPLVDGTSPRGPDHLNRILIQEIFNNSVKKYLMLSVKIIWNRYEWVGQWTVDGWCWCVILSQNQVWLLCVVSVEGQVTNNKQLKLQMILRTDKSSPKSFQKSRNALLCHSRLPRHLAFKVFIYFYRLLLSDHHLVFHAELDESSGH